MVDLPNRLYIVTVHLNNSSAFKETANSLVCLNKYFSDWEWIIKDGNSTEHHIQSLKSSLTAFQISNINIISCADRGIYDAMNQAVQYLSDDNAYCLFLNAGDSLNRSKLPEFASLFNGNSNEDIIYYDYLKLTRFGPKRINAPEKIDFSYLLGKAVNHQCLLIKVKWLKEYPFETNYRVVSDWIQLFNIMRNKGVTAKYINEPLVIYEGGGFSEKNDKLRLAERKQYLDTIYSEWEMDSLRTLSRLRTREWYNLLERALNSPKRSWLLSLLSRLI